MPLCPQITNTPITVTQTADFTVSSVLPVVSATTTQVNSAISAAALAQAEADAAAAAAAAAAVEAAAANAAAAAAVTAAASAATAAGEAQADATEALADAAAAYTAATGSLQPSASTIVNASNQMTAIAANGITVYSGASASSGARVVLNSTGLAGFNSVGTATFSISASTGAAVFSGSVTGSTITGGTLNINGNAIINASGLLTATGATITGDIRATAGYFGTATNGFSISSTGLVGVGTGTIVGGAIQGVTFTNGTTFSVTSTGFLTASNAEITGNIKATSGYIGSTATGWQFTSSGYLFSADTILYPTTSPGGDANTYSIFTGRGIYADRILVTNTQAAAVYSSGGLYALGALNVAASSGTPLFAVNTSGAVTAVAGITSQGAISSTGLSSSGSITSDGAVTFVSGSATQFQVLSSGLVRSLFTYNRQVSSARTLLINSSGDFGNSTSTRRHKHEIESYKINSSNLLKLQVKQYKYLESIDPEQKTQHGFIAEEAQELGLDELIQYDSTGIPDYFAYEKLPIFLLQLAQEQEARIKALEGK
jgi:trimeric autotransporter adhesin